jgi:hypothetical protein
MLRTRLKNSTKRPNVIIEARKLVSDVIPVFRLSPPPSPAASKYGYFPVEAIGLFCVHKTKYHVDENRYQWETPADDELLYSILKG